MPMPLMELTEDNFDLVTEQHNLILLDFWAPWCAPCKGFAPIFEAAAEKYPEILFAKVNTEEQVNLAKQFEVQSIPTLLAVKDGTIAYIKMGAQPPNKLEALIQDLIKFSP